MAGDYQRIDTHQHAVIEAYTKPLAEAGVGGSGERSWPDWSIESTLELMDETGIAASVLTIASPGTYFGDIDFTKNLVPSCNDALAQLVSDYSTRFGALGLVSLPDAAQAAKDVEYALDVLGLDGIGLVSHYGDYYLGDPAFDEFYAALDEREAVAFFHPVRPKSPGPDVLHYSTGTTELEFDSTRAIVNMLATGCLEKFPNIKWYMPHGGGMMPFLLYRICRFDGMPQYADKVPQGVRSYIKRLYYDVAQSIDPPALNGLMAIADPDRVLFGTDYPFAQDPALVLKETIAGVTDYNGFDAALRRKIEWDNAVALFPKLAARAGLGT